MQFSCWCKLSLRFEVRKANRLIRTMVVTYVPSNVLLILVSLMHNAPLAMLMIIARFSISQMDVPTRNAYVSGVVDTDERSAVSGQRRHEYCTLPGGQTCAHLCRKRYTNDIFFIAGG